MQTTVIIGGNMRQAKQELRRRIRELPRGSIERVCADEVETVTGERLMARSGQDPRCLCAIDREAEIVLVGQLELIRDEVWEQMDRFRQREI